MIRAHARWVAIGGALVLAVTLLGSGATIANEGDGPSIDLATQAAWLEDHFRCEYGAEMAEAVSIDLATQAAWLEDHFRCEYGAEMEVV